MKALAACRLTEADQAKFVEAVPHVLSGLDDSTECHLRTWIEVKDQTARDVRMERIPVPGMQFQARCLSNRGEPFDTIDLEIGLAVAPDGDELQ